MDPVVVSAVAQPGQISLYHLIMQASWPVFLVMVGLAMASVWCWAVIIEKYFAVRRMNSANDRFEQSFWSGQSLEDLYWPPGTRSNLGLSAISWRRCANGSAAGTRPCGPASGRAEAHEGRRCADSKGNEPVNRALFLPQRERPHQYRVFGTVWGIMTSFRQSPITEHQSCRRGAGHRGGPVCHGDRPRSRHTSDNLYNMFSATRAV
jgi:biopolymer transport protein TolQ